MENKEYSKRCDVVEKKRKMRDEKGISELSGSKVSPLRSYSSSSSSCLRPCCNSDMEDENCTEEVSGLMVRRLSRCFNLEKVDEKGTIEPSDLMVSPLSRCSNSVDEKRNTELKISNSDSEQLKTVFVSFIMYGAMQSPVYWYKIDPNMNTNSEIRTCVSPICSIPCPEIGRGFSSAALGSKVYMMGGIYGGSYGSADFDGSRDIFSFDTATIINNHSLVWHKERTQLLAKRCNPELVATHGKIYVFGSHLLGRPQPWGEVFDPVLNTCFPLPDPTFKKFRGNFEIAIVANGNKIFFCGTTALHCFDVTSNSWTQVSPPSSLYYPKHLSSRYAIVDDIMFSYFQGDVFAFDFATGTWFDKPVEGLGIPSTGSEDEGHVVHIGNGSLSVLWTRYDPDDKDWLVNGKRVFIRCLTFRVKRITNAEKGSFLVADILAQSTYCINSIANFFNNCVAL